MKYGVDGMVTVFRRMNFEVVRKFNCFRQTIKQVDLLQANKDCMVKLVDTEAVRLTQQACDFPLPFVAKQHRIH